MRLGFLPLAFVFFGSLALFDKPDETASKLIRPYIILLRFYVYWMFSLLSLSIVFSLLSTFLLGKLPFPQLMAFTLSLPLSLILTSRTAEIEASLEGITDKISKAPRKPNGDNHRSEKSSEFDKRIKIGVMTIFFSVTGFVMPFYIRVPDHRGEAQICEQPSPSKLNRNEVGPKDP